MNQTKIEMSSCSNRTHTKRGTSVAGVLQVKFSFLWVRMQNSLALRNLKYESCVKMFGG